MAAGEIEVLILADVNPVYGMPPKSGFVEALAKVPLVVSLASRPTDSIGQGRARSSRRCTRSSPGATTRRATASSGSCSRRWGPWRSTASRSTGKATGDILLSVGRQALGTEEGKGPLKWASFEAYVKEQWQGLAREYGAGKSFADFWEESLRRGGAWRASAPAAGGGEDRREPRERGARDARGRRHPRAHRLSLGALLRRPRAPTSRGSRKRPTP